jgi:hypothetical protein
LPTGAATAAKQPALGTAGTASADVITVQGIASMTPIVVDLGANNDVTTDQVQYTENDVDASITGNAIMWEADSNTLVAAGADRPLPVQVYGNDGVDQQILLTDSSGHLQIDVLTAPSTAVTNAGTFAVQPTAAATGGATPGKLISAANTNATSVKGSAGTLYMLVAMNVNAAARYLKLYNKATAPTVGTDTPVLTLMIPGNTAGAGVVVPIPSQGIAFGTGIALALTTAAADSDTGAVASGEIVLSYAYN